MTAGKSSRKSGVPKQSGWLAIWWKLVGFGFRLLYQEMAFTYDWVARMVSLGQWWEWQRTALPFLPPPENGLILELAFGTGHFQEDLHHGGWQSIGCDLSPQMGRIAAKRLKRKHLPVRLVRGRAQALPFPDQAFAAVVSTFPTPFIVEDATLAELQRVLVPGGKLVFVANGILTQGGAARALLEKAYQVTGQRGPWAIDEIEARFARHGFEMRQEYVELPRSLVTVVSAEASKV
jgi:ubiquinone/menaquinone biosynthesis C-methylase UbiE